MAIKTFIQKLKENSVDKLVSSRFKRFSVGDFPREDTIIKQTSKGVQVQTGFEYSNDLILLAANLLGDSANFEGEATLTAAKSDPTKQIKDNKFEIKSNRGKKYVLTFNLSGKDLISAVTDLGSSFALLFTKFKCDSSVTLKMKGSPPKPGSLKEKFCTLKTNNDYKNEVLKTFLFDLDESQSTSKFKSAIISHTFNIDDIKIPKEYENDYVKARLFAKKVGTISRKIMVADKEVLNEEFKFEA